MVSPLYHALRQEAYDPKRILPSETLLSHVRQEEAMALYQLAKESTGSIIEIGCYCGYSTLFLGYGIRNRDPKLQENAQVYTIDHHKSLIRSEMQKADMVSLHERNLPCTFPRFVQNCKDYKIWDLVHPVIDDSQEVWKQWPHPQCGLLFIDGDHSLALEDFWHWSSYVLPEGIVCFHDYSEEFPIIQQDIDFLISIGVLQKVSICYHLFVGRICSDVLQSPNVREKITQRIQSKHNEKEASTAVGTSAHAPTQKPHILLLIDKRHWAFHENANAIAFHLASEYECTIVAAQENPQIDVAAYDIIHVFGGEQGYHLPFLTGQERIVKGVYSQRWQELGLNTKKFYEKHLQDADLITVPNKILEQLLSDLPIPILRCPEGVDTDTFVAEKPHDGPLRVGWAGDATDPIKQLHLAEKACDGICALSTASGDLSLREMVDFYNSIDVILCTSKAEGCPRPVLEALSCGKFAVSFPVGMVPELVEHERNGLLVEDRNVEGVQSALQWCQDHLEDIRASWKENAAMLQSDYSWNAVMPAMHQVYETVLTMQPK